MQRSWIVGLFVGLFVFCQLSGEAQARRKNDTYKRSSDSHFVLGIDSSLLGYDLSTHQEKGEDLKRTDGQFNLALGSPNFALIMGGAFKEHFLLGARFGLNFNHTTMEYDHGGKGPSTDALAFTLSPLFEYIFLTKTVRPFIRLMMDMEVGYANINESDSGISEDLATTTWLLGFQAGAGMHIFPTDSFSIDLALMLGYGGGKSKSTYTYEDTETGEEDSNVVQRLDQTRFRFQLLFGFTGWI